VATRLFLWVDGKQALDVRFGLPCIALCRILNTMTCVRYRQGWHNPLGWRGWRTRRLRAHRRRWQKRRRRKGRRHRGPLPRVAYVSPLSRALAEDLAQERQDRAEGSLAVSSHSASNDSVVPAVSSHADSCAGGERGDRDPCMLYISCDVCSSNDRVTSVRK
jgi:hypothetical protein